MPDPLYTPLSSPTHIDKIVLGRNVMKIKFPTYKNLTSDFLNATPQAPLQRSWLTKRKIRMYSSLIKYKYGNATNSYYSGIYIYILMKFDILNKQITMLTNIFWCPCNVKLNVYFKIISTITRGICVKCLITIWFSLRTFGTISRQL